MDMESAAIRARGVKKAYGSTQALRGVDLVVEPGEVFALLGPNGAGKTTLVEVLEGYRRPDEGAIEVLGQRPGDSRDWKGRIGIVPQSTGVFDELTVDEIVGHFAGFYAHPMPVDRVVALVGLTEKRRTRCRQLSGGQKRRVDLALGLVGDPELIFLDEPTTGFDPGARRQAWETVSEMTSLGKTVLLTTHYLDEAEHLAHRVGVIAGGRMLEVAPPSLLGGRSSATVHVSFEPTGRLGSVPMPDIPGNARFANGRTIIETDVPTATVQVLAAWASALGIPELPRLTVERPSLEDAYLAMIEGAETEQAAVRS